MVRALAHASFFKQTYWETDIIYIYIYIFTFIKNVKIIFIIKITSLNNYVLVLI